jgi:hypothetical protein
MILAFNLDAMMQRLVLGDEWKYCPLKHCVTILSISLAMLFSMDDALLFAAVAKTIILFVGWRICELEF